MIHHPVILGTWPRTPTPAGDAIYINCLWHTISRRGVATRPLQPQVFVVAAAALVNQIVDKLFIVDVLWGGNPEGGPLTALDHLRVRSVHANAELAPLGIRIRSDYRRRFFAEISDVPDVARFAA